MQKYAKVTDEDGLESSFSMEPHLEELYIALLKHRYVIVLKSRQIWITWAMAGYALWVALFKSSAHVMLLSKHETAGGEMLGYVRFIHNRLPNFLRFKKGSDQEGLITFPELNSKIRVLSTTAESGIGFGRATLIISDEFEFHEFAERNYAEIIPMVSAGGQYVITSAPNQWKTGTQFKKLWHGAKAGENDFYPLFFNCFSIPGRDGEWYKEQVRQLGDLLVKGRYPRTEDEALTPIETTLLFSPDVLAEMDAEIRTPIQTDEINTFNGLVNVFKLPVVGGRYVIFTDPSDGKEDPFHTVVMDWSTGEGVCEAHGMVTADICALIHDTLARFYNFAFNSYELNASAGGKFDETIKNLGTPNICPFVKPNKTLDMTKKAWWTSNELRKWIIWGLEEKLRRRQIITHDRYTLTQFKGMIIPKGKDPQVTEGMHDDAVIAWGACCAISRFMPIAGEIRSFRYQVSA